MQGSPGSTRYLVRFDHRPGFKTKKGIGVGLYLAQFRQGEAPEPTGIPINEVLVWSGNIKPLRSGNLSPLVWSKWKAIAQAIQDKINGMPGNRLKEMMLSGRATPVEEIAAQIVKDSKAIERRAKIGCIYNRGGWKIVHPFASVWVVNIPDFLGSVSAIVDELSQRVLVESTATKTGGMRRLNTTGIRSGLIAGVKIVYEASSKLFDVNRMEAMLDDAGLKDDMHGILSIKTHRRLHEVLVQLTDAAHADGVAGIDRCLVEFARKIGKKA